MQDQSDVAGAENCASGLGEVRERPACQREGTHTPFDRIHLGLP